MLAIKGISIHPCIHLFIFQECHPVCVCARILVLGSRATGFHLCLSQMILSSWILWSRTFSVHTDGLQLSVKQL